MGRLLKESILDIATKKSGIRIRRLDEAQKNRFGKIADAAAQSILKQLESFSREVWNDPDSQMQDEYKNRAEFIEASVEEHADYELGEFMDEVRGRLEAHIKMKYPGIR